MLLRTEMTGGHVGGTAQGDALAQASLFFAFAIWAVRAAAGSKPLNGLA
jgi:protease II